MTAVREPQVGVVNQAAAPAALRLSGTVHGQPVSIAVDTVPQVLAEIGRWTAIDPRATGSWGLSGDYSDPVTLIARRQPGSCAESRRVAHLFELVPGIPQGLCLTSRCGEAIPIVRLEWLTPGRGMPCEACLHSASHAGH